MINHIVIDNWFPRGLLDRVTEQWPDADAPWVHYNTADQRKRTLGCMRINGVAQSCWHAIPPACRELLTGLMHLDLRSLLRDIRAVPDTLLWGAGLCEMRQGDFLRTHLDADRHPLTGLERRANAILFAVPEWRPEWGGALELAGALPILPAPGRLVLFETNDASWHGVPVPLTCPVEVARRTVSVYWWGLPRGESKRPRALFV
jgi:hypothetical protein